MGVLSGTEGAASDDLLRKAEAQGEKLAAVKSHWK